METDSATHRPMMGESSGKAKETIELNRSRVSTFTVCLVPWFKLQHITECYAFTLIHMTQMPQPHNQRKGVGEKEDLISKISFA